MFQLIFKHEIRDVVFTDLDFYVDGSTSQNDACADNACDK